MMRSAFDMVSACASVLATTKSTPASPLVIMLLTALPPAPPHPNTVIRGFSSRMSGIFRLMVMVASSLRGACSFDLRMARKATAATPPGRTGPPPAWSSFLESSEALPQPSSDPCEISACSCRRMPRSPRFEVFEMHRLRIDEQTRRHRKGRSFGFLRQPRNAERPADAHRPAENLPGQLYQSGELTGAAGENHPAARLGRERRVRQPVTNHFQNFFDPRLDDAHKGRARDELRRFAVVVVARRNRDHVALVRTSRQHAAIQGLDSLGVRNAGIQSARQIERHVVAAERKAVDMNEAAAGEDRDAGRAGAHVDQRRSQIS